MAEDIAQWLDRPGLGQYAQVFAENGIDLDIVPSLSDDDLRVLGLKSSSRWVGSIRKVYRIMLSSSGMKGTKNTQ